MRVEVEHRTLRLRTPLVTAHGAIAARRLLTVRLAGEDGVLGTGEAAPLEPYDGVSITAVRDAIERCRAVLEGDDGPSRDAVLAHGPALADGPPHAALLERCAAFAPPPQALAAIDLALWDLAGRRAGRAVARLLTGDPPAAAVTVNATVGARDRAGAVAQAADAVRAGFRCVKVKVGVGDDAGRLAAIRAAVGPDVALRIDANGAWDVPGATAHLRALAPVGIELAEEPVHGVTALAALRRATDVWLAMDETAADAGAVGSGATQAVCLKIARCGGISGLLADAARAQAAGSAVYLASTLDGPTGIAAALHAAAALAPLPPCGLATLGGFADEADAFPPKGGAIAVPAGPGLGTDG